MIRTVTIRGRRISLAPDGKSINRHDPEWPEVMFEVNKENLASIREQNRSRLSRAA